MNTIYTIKNFRVFDEKGVTVDIKPITILTGCNSSGKSSIVKSMVLLDTYIQNLLDDYKAFNKIQLHKYKLDFSKENTSSLGNFNRVKHEGSEEETISFQYQVHSLLLGEDVIVSFVFGTDENDLLSQGYLRSFSICKKDGSIIYSSSSKDKKDLNADFNLILDNFFRFAFGQFITDIQDEYKYKRYHLYGLQTEEEFNNSLNGMLREVREKQEEEEKELKNFKSALDDIENSFKSLYGESPLIDIKRWMSNNIESHHDRSWNFDSQSQKKLLIYNYTYGHPEIVNISLKWNTLFYFPLLEVLYNVDSLSFKDVLLNMFDSTLKKKEVIFAINKISDDFKASGKTTFGEYYKMKEFSLLNFSRDLHGFPTIRGYKFWNVYSYYNHIYGESFLQTTRRILGPGFVDSEVGIISTIGPGEVKEWKDCPVNFTMVYDVMLNLDHLLHNSDNHFYKIIDELPEKHYHMFEHNLFNMFVKYVSMFLEEVVTSAIPHNLSYIGTSLVNVKRDYTFDTNDAFSLLIKRYLEAKRNYTNCTKNSNQENDSFINRWIRKLDIGHSVKIILNPSGSSYTIRLYKNAEDSVGSLLAEEGYGITQLITLLLRIETAIMESEKKDISDPYVDTDVTYEYAESTIAVEEPEVHLHPKFQSLLAEIFVEAYKNYNVHFIVETHSEYLIRKLQTLVANKEVVNKELSIVYFYDANPAKRPPFTDQIKMIGFEKDGRLNSSFGEGFFDEADRLSMNLLNIKVANDEKK